MSQRDREDGSLYPLGGHGSQPGDFQSDQVDKSGVKGGTVVGGTLAELYAKGESFIEGAADTVGGWASSAVNSVSGLLGGNEAQTFGVPNSPPLDTTPIQQAINWEERAQALRDLNIPGLSVGVLKR